ncbi:MAG: hypothetical protein H0W23_00135 [Chloroflexia bacterium]|nr:hypothetical protein [Chloroflexia bacterium]
MKDRTINELVDQLRDGAISRRAFTTRTAAAGVSASAAAILSRHAVAQDASPEATPGATPVGSPVASPQASPVAGGGTRSITREEFNAALREEFQFEEPASTGGQVVYVSTSDITTLNPTLVVDVFSGLITGFVFQGLVGGSPIDGALVPELADYWEVADDGVTYTFYLNRNATWHDGRPVTADDVIFTFDSVIAEDSLSVRRSSVVNALKSHTKIDDYTVQLVAVDRLANFVADTAGQFGILPKHIWEGVPFAEWGTDPGSTGQDPSKVIGSGPFRFVEWVRTDHVTLERTPDFWDAQNAPVIDQFIYRVVVDSATAVQTLVTGESDITGIPPTQTATLRASNPELSIVDFDTFSFTYYEFNLDPANDLPFLDVRVRQALMYALDRDLVVDTVFQGLATKADGTQPVLSSAYDPERINTIYNYDPDRANALLEEAGWVDSDGDGIREKDGEKFSFEFLYSEGSTVNEQLIPYMQQAWGEIGVEMIPVQQPFPTLVDNQENGTFAASLIGFSWDVTGGQGDMYRCDAVPLAGFNDMRYCNEEYDRLDDLQQRELDPDKRVDILIEQSNIINDEQANSVLVFAKNVVGSQPRLHNFFPNGYGTFWSIPYVWVEQE